MVVPPPSTVNQKVSPELDAIVLQALDRERKLRYARASHMARDLDVFLQAHRFAVEDMAEYLKEVWPLDAREEVPDGAMTSSYSIPKTSEPTAPSSPRAIAGTPSAVRAERVQAEAKAAAARKRLVLLGGAALVAVGVAAAVVVPLARRAAPAGEARDEPRMIVEPAARTVEPDKPLAGGKPIDRPLEASHASDVRVTSEPAGAQVFAGPKLVGVAPVTLHLGARDTAPVTLVHPGYEDLNYTVQSGDAPSLTLRMLRRHHVADATTHKAAAAPATPRDKGPHKAKIDTFDDGDKTPHVPKVQPIDD